MAVPTAHSHENKIPVRQSSIFHEANKNVPRTLSRWSLRTASMVPGECDSVKRACVCTLPSAVSSLRGKWPKALLKIGPCQEKPLSYILYVISKPEKM